MQTIHHWPHPLDKTHLPIPRNVQTQVPKHRLTDHSGCLNWELIKCFNWKSLFIAAEQRHSEANISVKHFFGESSLRTRNNCFWLVAQSIPTWFFSQCIRISEISLIQRSVTTDKEWDYISYWCQSDQKVCFFLCRVSIQFTRTEKDYIHNLHNREFKVTLEHVQDLQRNGKSHSSKNGRKFIPAIHLTRD
jgi:hypothetical protein